MGTRRAKSFWTRAIQRQVGAITRRAVRASSKMVKQSLKQSVTVSKQRAAPKKQAGWRSGMALGPKGLRRYRLYKPPQVRAASKCALVVMLHGCAQDADSFAASTRMNRLAATAGFMVVYPEQDRLANLQACWNWFDTRSGRALAEAASIVAVIDQVCAAHPVEPRRIVVAGLSAGASMAALLALTYPQRFAAVAMHSGVGPGLAKSSATALAAMRGRFPADGTTLVAAPSTLPALLVIQGNRDPVVSPVNGGLAARRWAAIANASPAVPRQVRRGERYTSIATDWKVGRRVVASLAEIQGLGHAWSGGAASQAFSDPAGPDASRMVWAFAQREFARRERLAEAHAGRGSHQDSNAA